MANVVKKHSISSELAQKMVDEAVAKARKIGVSENVATLDDGGNLKASPLAVVTRPCGAGAGGLLGRAGGRAARWHYTGWAYAARGKGRLNFLYSRLK